MRAEWSERELEDWLWEHPEALDCRGLRWLGRQVPLPSGQRLDLLGVVGQEERSTLIVAELKAVTADGEALAQLLSYLHVLRMAIYNRSMDFLPEYVEDTRDVARTENPVSDYLDPYGYLIAPAFTPRAVLGAGDAAVTCRFVHQSFGFGHINYAWEEERTRADWPNALTDILRDALNGTE